LLDAHVPGAAGGTGARFDWNIAVQARELGHPLILAGGLKPENIAEAVRQVRPFAVDVSSGVEIAPGRKDPERIRRLIDAARGV
jgi:phosphoribosylanthranilate isomerase